MRFYNFFTNIKNSPCNEDKKEIARIKQMLIHGEDQTFYSPATEFNRISQDTVNSIEFMKQLNPTVFQTIESQTLPFLSFLNRKQSAAHYIRSNNPQTAFLRELQAAGNVRDLDAKISVIYSLFTHITHRSCFISDFFKSNSRAPNKNFLYLLKVFENTHNLSNQYHLNLEAHQHFLENGHVCWVDSLEHCQSLNDTASSTPIKEIAKIYIAFFEHLLKKKNNIEDNNHHSLGSLIWNTLYQTDNNPNFLHLTFEKPTEVLLNLTEKQIKDKIAMFSSIEIFNYLQMNSLESTDNEKVYSHFSNQFFTKFKENSEDPNLSNENNLIKIDSNPIDLRFTSSNLNETTWTYSNLFARNNQDTIQCFPPKGDGRSNSQYIPLAGTTGLLIDDTSGKYASLDVASSLQANPNKRVFGLMLNAFTKATLKPSFEFITLTKKQALIRKGFFIPVLLKFLSCNEEGAIETAYNFSLMNYSDNLSSIIKRKRSRDQIIAFYNAYGEDGLRLINYQKFLLDQKKKIKKLAEYSFANAPTFSNYSSVEINQLLSCLNSIKNSHSKKASQSLVTFSDKLTAKLNLEPSITKKYNKVSSNYKKLVSQNTEERGLVSDFARNIEQGNMNIEGLTRTIQENQNRMKEMKKQLSESTLHLKTSFNKRVDLIETICANKSLYLKVLKDYNKATEIALSQQDYSQNDFFKNIYETESVKILSIASSKQIIDCTNSENYLDDLATKIAGKKENFLIKEVIFLIDAPVKINVDGGRKGQIVGGPYLVAVKKDELKIKLAYPSSIHGYSDESKKIYIHPHSGSCQALSLINYFQQLESHEPDHYWSRACLGEASSLIYRAFEKENDLKLILISALTWVKNANSADTWGKNYKYFPKYSQIQEELSTPLLNQQEITEEDVGDFIEEMIVSEEENLQEEPNQQQPLQQEQENVTEAHTEPVSQVYVPYTQR
jgi:hypothetical protein